MSLNFNTYPYYDDYNPDKNFYKILFKGGYAVQARELNQMQSILQHQVSTFANHIFKKNSMVIPGGIVLKTDAPLLFSSNIDLSGFIGKTITNAPLINGVYPTDTSHFDNYITAVVLGYKIADDLFPSCLYVKYFNSYRGSNVSTDPNRSLFTIEDNIYTIENSPQQIVLSGDGVGIGKVVSIDKGVFYTKELFVDVAPQSLIIEANSYVITNCDIGLNIIESIVDATQDESLLDNAQGFPNQYAPGADRYKIELILTRVDANTTISDDKFISLMSIDNDVITYLNNNAQYSELMKTLAKRTYDANGNFIVNGLKPSVTQSNDDGYVWISVGRGNCYLGGYEYSQITDINIPILKPRDDGHTESAKNVSTYIDDSPYFFVAGGKNTPSGPPNYEPFLTYLPEPNELIQFIRSIPPLTVLSSDIVGYGIFKSMEYYSGNVGDLTGPSNVVYKMYVDNINLNSGVSIKDIGGFKKVGASSIGAPILHEISIESPQSPIEAANDNNEDMFERIVYSSNAPLVPDNTFNELGYLYYSGNNKLYLLKKESTDIIPDTATMRSWLNIPIVKKSTFVSNYTGNFNPIIKIDNTNIKTLKPTATNGIQNTSYSIIKSYSGTLAENDGFATADFSAIAGASFEDFSVNDYSVFVVYANESIPVSLTSSNIVFNNLFTTLTVKLDVALTLSTIKIYTTQTKTNAIETTYNSNTGTITIPTPSASWMALGHPNVQELVSVLDTGSLSVAPNDLNDLKIDITPRFILDSMITASGLYTSLIKLKKYASRPTGQLLVTYKYNEIDSNGIGDFSSVDSYYVENDTTFNYIGKIKDVYDNNKQPIPIRNYLDFRPTYYNTIFRNYGYTKVGINTQIFLKDLNISSLRDLFDSAQNSTPLYIIGPGIEHGVDIVNLSQVGEDTVVNVGNSNGQNKGTYYIGVPSSFKLSDDAKEFVFPKSLAKFTYGYIKFKPKHVHLYVNRENDNLYITSREINNQQEIQKYVRDEYILPLAYIYMAPYTANMSDISMRVFENPVYKMLDIHAIKNRVDRNEYYTSLALNKDMEQEISDAANEDETLSNKGFWNEDFSNSFDQEFGSDDFKCTIYDKSHVGPGTLTQTINLDRINNETNGFYKITGSSITLPYVSVRAFGVEPASTFNNLNPYNVVNWNGKLTLNPTVDNWIDTVTLPVIVKPVTLEHTPDPLPPVPVPVPIPVPIPVPPPVTPPIVMPPPVYPPVIVPPPPKPIEEIVTEINNLKVSWGPDIIGGRHAITFDWKTNLGRTGRVNTDEHISNIIMRKGCDGKYALSLINKRYEDVDVKNYLNAGTPFDIKPPSKWKFGAFGQLV